MPRRKKQQLEPSLPDVSPTPERLLEQAARFLQIPREEEKQFVPRVVEEAQLAAENAELEALLAQMQALTGRQTVLQKSMQQQMHQRDESPKKHAQQEANNKATREKKLKKKELFSKKKDSTQAILMQLRNEAAQDATTLQKVTQIAETQEASLRVLRQDIALLQEREKNAQVNTQQVCEWESKLEHVQRQHQKLESMCMQLDKNIAEQEPILQHLQEQNAAYASLRQAEWQKREQEWKEKGAATFLKMRYADVCRTLPDAFELQSNTKMRSEYKEMQLFLNTLSVEVRQELTALRLQPIIRQNVAQSFRESGIQLTPAIERDAEALFYLAVEHCDEACFLYLLTVGEDKTGQTIASNDAILEKAMGIAKARKSEKMIDWIRCANDLECGLTPPPAPPPSLIEETISSFEETFRFEMEGGGGMGNAHSKFM